MFLLPLGHPDYCKLQLLRRHYSSSIKGKFIKVQRKPSLWQVLVSVFGALFGVQSTAVRERDFTQGHPWWVYVITATVVVAILVALLILVAKVIVGPLPP